MGLAITGVRIQEEQGDSQLCRGLLRIQDWQWLPAHSGRNRAIQHRFHKECSVITQETFQPERILCGAELHSRPSLLTRITA